MMRPKVLNLIQKFEKLTNEISSPKHAPPERQKSVAAAWRLEEPPPSPSLEATPAISQQCQHGWSNKPLVAIEEGIRGLTKKIENVNPNDEKAVFALFMEMLDLLIQLSSIDTDGLKSMKIKKECCVVDLKKARYQLTELVGINEKDVCKATDPETARAESHPVASTTGAGTTAATAVIVNHDSDYEDYTDDDDDEETALGNSTENTVANDMQFLRSGVVNSLTKKFESEHKQEKTGFKMQTMPKLVQAIHTMESDSDLELEEDEEEDDTRSAPSSLKNISGQDIISEIEYYQDIVPSLDREDFIKIESIEEHLEGLLVAAESYPEPKQRIVRLLKQVRVLKEVDVVPPVITYSHVRDDGASAEAARAQCAGFLRGERADVWRQMQTIPEIVLDEPEAQPSTDEQNDDGRNGSASSAGSTNADESHVTNDKTSAAGRPANQIGAQNDRIRVLDINTPGDHLTASLVMLNTYKGELQDYLEGTKEDLLQHMAAIEGNLQVINKYTPHPNVEQQFVELRNSYQEVFDFITEAKFAEIFNETFEEKNDNGSIRESVDAINNFHNLCAEVRNYYPFVEKLNLKEAAQVEVLRENMTDLFDEIEKNEVSFNADLQSEKDVALKEIEALIKRLDEQT